VTQIANLVLLESTWWICIWKFIFNWFC